MSVVSDVARNILRAGLDDWVPLAAVEGFARKLGNGTDQDILERSIEAIGELAERGFVEIGEVSDGGFFEWPETLEESLNRISTIWETTDANTRGFAVWFSNTPTGDDESRLLQIDDTSR
jgi:hypothetical protein